MGWWKTKEGRDVYTGVVYIPVTSKKKPDDQPIYPTMVIDEGGDRFSLSKLGFSSINKAEEFLKAAQSDGLLTEIDGAIEQNVDEYIRFENHPDLGNLALDISYEDYKEMKILHGQKERYLWSLENGESPPDSIFDHGIYLQKN